MMVQYWRSTEHLLRYARTKDREHFPAWTRFREKAASTSVVGIWHETFQVRADAYECIYGNFPSPFGLGKVGELVPATGKLAVAKKRLARRAMAAPRGDGLDQASPVPVPSPAAGVASHP